MISSQSSSQLETIGNVQLVTTFCTTATNGGTSCGAASAEGATTVVKIGYSIPAAANAPSSFGTVSGRSLTFTPDSSYTASQAGVTVPSGNKWVGYSSNSFTYNGAAETVRVQPQFVLTRGPDGSPFSGGFPYSVTVQQSDSTGLSKPSTLSGTQATRDLGVKHADASVPAGRTASVAFDLKYAGASGAGPFTVTASTDVPGATATPSTTSVTPASDSENNVTARVPVPVGTSLGTYHVTVTEALANGQTRTGTAQLTVTAPVPQVKQISAGFDHSCAILHNGTVRCWGNNSLGQLGLGNTNSVGMTSGSLPDSVPPVDLGSGRTALQISAGVDHTCALLDNHQVRCWGDGAGGDLGQGNQSEIGDNETPGSVGPIDLGGSHTAVAVPPAVPTAARSSTIARSSAGERAHMESSGTAIRPMCSIPARSAPSTWVPVERRSPSIPPPTTPA